MSNCKDTYVNKREREGERGKGRKLGKRTRGGINRENVKVRGVLCGCGDTQEGCGKTEAVVWEDGGGET